MGGIRAFRKGKGQLGLRAQGFIAYSLVGTFTLEAGHGQNFLAAGSPPKPKLLHVGWVPETEGPWVSHWSSFELLSKLLVSPLISPIVLPYIIPYIFPFKEFRLWLILS